MIRALRRVLHNVFNELFRSKKDIKLGLYGPPNGGKTTLANVICKDWLRGELGTGSPVPH